MGWPQLVLLALVAIGLGVALARHGKPLTGSTNFWSTLAHSIFYVALLWFGGFFSPAHAQVPEDAVKHRSELIRNARAVWGINAPIATFAAQVHQESGWRPGAVSQVGAQGMAQFMPATSKWIAGLDPELAVNQPFNTSWALRALVTFDKYLYDRTPARYAHADRMWVALRGYNGGLGHWQAEALKTGLKAPTRAQVDAACGKARRSAIHCPENLGYPQRIVLVLQPRYLSWGPGV